MVVLLKNNFNFKRRTSWNIITIILTKTATSFGLSKVETGESLSMSFWHTDETISKFKEIIMDITIWEIKNIFTDFSLTFVNEKDAEDVAIALNKTSHLQDDDEKEYFVEKVKVLGSESAKTFL